MFPCLVLDNFNAICISTGLLSCTFNCYLFILSLSPDAILKFVGKAVNGFIVPLDEEYDELLEDGLHEQQHLINTPPTVVTFSSTNPSTK